ncbi:MAG TPA: hypothetical protein VFV75_17980 [Candidatus Polarisedimenticolaceae bacterium]|nr:hypothetical protein [Candidatus Polarisedimenticolaceae bacterium]
MRSTCRPARALGLLLIVTGWAGAVAGPQQAALAYRPAGLESLPAPGALAWAEAVAKAREDFDHAGTGNELAAPYRRLTELYGDCAGCRDGLRRWLERKLKAIPADEGTGTLTLAVESDLDPLSRGRLLVQTGRAKQAEQLVTAELQRTTFPEHRMELLEVLGEAKGKLGDAAAQRRIATQLLEQVPVSFNYCDRALVWMSWLGEEPLPSQEFVDPASFQQVFDRLRALEIARGNDAYASCRVYHTLELWNRTGEGPKRFPQGIAGPLRDLARRTTDPKVRASLLLAAAFHVFATPDAKQALPLIREAKAVRDLPSIELGAWRFETIALSLQGRELRQVLAVRMIDRYPRSEASCEGCVEYWNALHHPYPELPPDRTEDWREKCLPVLRQCPDQVASWSRLSTVSSDAGRSRDMCQAILDMGPPDEVVPAVLLRLAGALRDSEPQRAWENERAAIVHPEYPGLDHEFEKYAERQQRAERHGDFETALYLELLTPHGVFLGDCLPGDDGLQETYEIGRAFRRAYFRLRMGGDPDAAWASLIALLPTAPREGVARRLLQPEYLERLLEAARATHHEASALAWFRGVRAPGMEAVLDAYVRRLESP